MHYKIRLAADIPKSCYLAKMSVVRERDTATRSLMAVGHPKIGKWIKRSRAPILFIEFCVLFSALVRLPQKERVFPIYLVINSELRSLRAINAQGYRCRTHTVIQLAGNQMKAIVYKHHIIYVLFMCCSSTANSLYFSA